MEEERVVRVGCLVPMPKDGLFMFRLKSWANMRAGKLFEYRCTRPSPGWAGA